MIFPEPSKALGIVPSGEQLVGATGDQPEWATGQLTEVTNGELTGAATTAQALTSVVTAAR